MNEPDESLALLPNGFADVLPPEAEGEASSIYKLMECFRGYGYRRIKPPLLEFEDSLMAPGPGAHLSSETFRLMDPVSNRMLGVRSDTTAQIARLVSSRLKSKPHPLRLTYANDVLRTRGSQMRTERQFTQVGCELIDNTDEIFADIEICVLPLIGLKALGIADITLDLTIPGCVAQLVENIDLNDRADVNRAIERRDVDALTKMSSSYAHQIAEIMQASGYAKDALKNLEAIKGLDGDIKQQIGRIGQLCAGIETALKDMDVCDVNLTIDLIEQNGFEYHKDYGFTLFSSASSGELGRGGAYDLRFGEKEIIDTARGFTLYMDTISRFTPASTALDCVFVQADTLWKEVKALQEDGWITIRGVEKDNVPEACSHIYRDGVVEKL